MLQDHRSVDSPPGPGSGGGGGGGGGSGVLVLDGGGLTVFLLCPREREAGTG